MKLFTCLSLLAATVFAQASVKQLTNDNFDDFIKNEKVALIKFFAPWCGHCKSLAPEFEKAAQTLTGEVALAEVDCDQADQKPICSRFDVRGYPTLKVFDAGVPTDYQGTREADGIVSYMKKFTAPVVSMLKGDEVASFSTSDRVVVIGFGAEGSQAFEDFKKVATAHRMSFKFGWSTDAGSIAKYRSGVTLFKKFDDGEAKLNDPFTEKSLSEFIETESIPLMDDIGPNNYARYMEAGLPLVYLFSSSAEEKKSAGAIVEPFAKTYKGKMNFVHIDAMKFGGHAPYLNTEQKWPALVIHNKSASTDLKYPFPQDMPLTVSDVEKYFADFASGSLKPKFKSEPEPETNDGPVVTVTHSSYDRIVNDKTKDVLLELYAPWCGHCKKLAPIYDELGKLFPSGSNVVIAKFNGDANDLLVSAGYTIEGFPTLKLFKAGDNKIVDYHGGHTLEALLQFLKDNATNKIDVTLPEKSAEPAHDHDHDHDHDDL
jgi:protein disulfide-isomerase A1